jgi:hypothetical protein
VDEIGRNSVSPSTTPITAAFSSNIASTGGLFGHCKAADDSGAIRHAAIRNLARRAV